MATLGERLQQCNTNILNGKAAMNAAFQDINIFDLTDTSTYKDFADYIRLCKPADKSLFLCHFDDNGSIGNSNYRDYVSMTNGVQNTGNLNWSASGKFDRASYINTSQTILWSNIGSNVYNSIVMDFWVFSISETGVINIIAANNQSQISVNFINNGDGTFRITSGLFTQTLSFELEHVNNTFCDHIMIAFTENNTALWHNGKSITSAALGYASIDFGSIALRHSGASRLKGFQIDELYITEGTNRIPIGDFQVPTQPYTL